MTQTLRWGILSTGNIARQFADGVAQARRGVVHAVGSRSAESAAAFAQPRGIPHALGSYDELIDHPDINAVYIGLPNSMHHEWAIRALRAGKHVLCEKPLASNAQQAAQMFEEARRADRLLVEAFMYRSHPLTAAWLARIRAGDIGKVRLLRASFCFFTGKPQGNIRFDAGLHGGALMDVGCYCVNLARLVANAEPVAVHAQAVWHESGVDELTVGSLTFADGMIASFTCGMRVQADNTASICGEGGYIEIPVPWKPPMTEARYVIRHATPPRMDGSVKPLLPRAPQQEQTVSAEGSLYGLEADAFAQAVFGERLPEVSEADTLSNMRVLDELRRQIGLRF
ncbi:MAG: Gfo/Idh/MocA family oxidoreductase [Phycisphaeraceae bacterium]